MDVCVAWYQFPVDSLRKLEVGFSSVPFSGEERGRAPDRWCSCQGYTLHTHSCGTSDVLLLMFSHQLMKVTL